RGEAVARGPGVLRRALHDARKIFAERLDLHFLELVRDPVEHVAQAGGLEQPNQEGAAAHLRLAEQEGGVHPALLDRGRQVLGEVLDGRGAARQPFEHGLEVAHQTGAVDLEVAQDPVHVRIREIDDLKEPVHQLDMRIAAELAEGNGPLGGLEHDRIELAEQSRTADLRHGSSPLMPPPESSDSAAYAPVPKPDRRRPWPPAELPATTSSPAAPRGRGGFVAPRRGPGRAARPSRTRTRRSCGPNPGAARGSGTPAGNL